MMLGIMMEVHLNNFHVMQQLVSHALSKIKHFTYNQLRSPVQISTRVSQADMVQMEYAQHFCHDCKLLTAGHPNLDPQCFQPKSNGDRTCCKGIATSRMMDMCGSAAYWGVLLHLKIW